MKPIRKVALALGLAALLLCSLAAKAPGSSITRSRALPRSAFGSSFIPSADSYLFFVDLSVYL